MDAQHQTKIFQVMEYPSFYPHSVSILEQRETHISRVFLTGEYVYKVKKAVNIGFLDFSTLEKRKHFCHQEVILNRRLAPDIYLDVVPITFQNGNYYLNGAGEPVEYAVKMRQLSDSYSMSRLLETSRIDKKEINALADIMATFYKKADINEYIKQFGSWVAISKNLADNFEHVEVFVGDILDEQIFQIVRAATRSFLHRRKSLFQHRIEKGKIRDCHGDLKAEHIYFTENGIYIIDCIEFNEQFRYLDIASDLAFLTMELDYAGYSHLGQYLLNLYVDHTGDHEVFILLDLYKCYRAIVRCKVNCLRLLGCDFRKAESRELLSETQKYMDLAYEYAVRFTRPTLWVVCGMQGSGKSTISKKLGDVLDLRIFHSDVVRKELFGIAPKESKVLSYGQDIYSKGATSLTYGKILLLAQEELEKGRSVILDATYGSRHHRQNVLSLAKDMDVNIIFIECVASDIVLKERLVNRESTASVSDARIHHFEAFKKQFEPMDEIGREMYIQVNTEEPVEESMRHILSGDYPQNLNI